MKKTLINIKNLKKEYKMGNVTIKALRGIDLEIKEGDFTAIMGSSGCGKSTLMNLLGCLDSPTSGDYIFNGRNIEMLTKDEYADIRNSQIGFVFQSFNLLSKTSSVENVELPLLYDRKKRILDHRKAALEALKVVGLEKRVDHLPNELSGGQQQRVAIARAIVTDPPIILADEPTGNLDSVTTVEIMKLIVNLNKQGKTILLVTHEDEIAEYANRVIWMKDGRIIEDIVKEK